MTRVAARWAPPIPPIILVIVAACGIPTELPVIDSQWLVPLRSDSVTIAELVPDGVMVDGAHFVLDAPPTDADRTLGALCPSCPNGFAPKPAFEGSIAAGTTLPGDVVRATLAAGSDVAFTLRHELTFDPLRPSATNRGTITITLSSGGAVIATSVVDGTDVALPPLVPYQHVVPLPAGTVVEHDVEVEVTVVSPAGEPAQLDRTQRVFVSVAPRDVRATAAVVRVEDRAVSPTATELNTGDVNDEIRSRVLHATLEFAIHNPLPVAGEFTLRFLAQGAPVIADRPVTLAAGDQTIEVPLEREEIDALLAADLVVVEFAGAVTGTTPNREVAVTPAQVIRVVPRLFLAVQVGG